MPFVQLVGQEFFIKASGVEDDLHFHGLVESLASVRQNEQFADLVISIEICINNDIFVSSSIGNTFQCFMIATELKKL